MSFGELAIVVIVGLIVIGPKELPKVLRKLGQWAGKLRRMAADLRSQSGIDDALRTEGLTDDLQEIRKLARGELDGVVRAASVVATASTSRYEPLAPVAEPTSAFYVERDRENPREGPDSYGAVPDTAIVYADSFPKSDLARDPLYLLGDAGAALPVPEPEPTPTDAEAPEGEAPPVAEPPPA
jgi:sec-independent protein translocase protein TatB